MGVCTLEKKSEPHEHMKFYSYTHSTHVSCVRFLYLFARRWVFARNQCFALQFGRSSAGRTTTIWQPPVRASIRLAVPLLSHTHVHKSHRSIKPPSYARIGQPKQIVVPKNYDDLCMEFVLLDDELMIWLRSDCGAWILKGGLTHATVSRSHACELCSPWAFSRFVRLLYGYRETHITHRDPCRQVYIQGVPQKLVEV